MSVKKDDSRQMTDNPVREFFNQTLEYTGNPQDRISSRQMVQDYNNWKEHYRKDAFIPKFFNMELATYLDIPIHMLKKKETDQTYYIGFKYKENKTVEAARNDLENT